MRRILFGLALAGFSSWPVAAQQLLPRAFEAIDTIVVIYAENRGFVHLLPRFPGAIDLAAATDVSLRQKDRDGSVLPSLPPVWKAGTTEPDPDYPASMPNAPFA